MGKKHDAVIFCDFDGTITKEETFVGALSILCTEEQLKHWFGLLLDKKITLRNCTETLFSLAPSANYPKVEEYAKTIEIREGFGAFLDKAEELGIPVVILSGGIKKMQEIMMEPFKDRIEALYSCDLNTEGEFTEFTSEYCNEEYNMDKAYVMSLYDCKTRICLGDSLSDFGMVEAADVTFARDSLADYMEENNKPYYRWESFDEITSKLEEIVNSIK